MDMNLDKRILHVYETVLDTGTIHDENTEIIVPDASPDISRIICAVGRAYVKDKTARDGKIDISGAIKGCVLYVSEGDDAMRKLEVSMPFSHTFDGSGVTSESQVLVNTWMQSFEAREVNPRKISVRGNVGIAVKAYEKKELEICTGCNRAEEYAIEEKRQTVGVYAPIAVKEKGFTITDDVELPSGKPQLVSIVSHNAELSITDMKIIGNKAIIKGNAYVSYMYHTKDGGLEVCEHELPFSQIIDADGMNEDCKLQVKLNVRGVELEPQHDLSGDTRFIGVSILADTCVLAYCNDEIEAIEDIYSTKYEINCEFEGKAIPRFSEHISKRIAVSETVETAGSIEAITDLTITLEPAAKRKEEGGESMVNEAVITIMYLSKDGGIYCASRRCSVVCPLGEASDINYDCSAGVNGKNYSMTGGNEVIVRFSVDYEMDAVLTEKVVSISSVEVDTEKTKCSPDSPSVIIKYINNDLPLWETAKRYNTTMREIAAANALDNEEFVRAGSMLLIPKAR